MNNFQLIWKTFLHYFNRNLLVTLGVAVSTAVLTGALIIGDSVRYSLEQTTLFRLGDITHAASVTDRYFHTHLAERLETETGFKVAPALILEGIAVADGGQQRVNKVQITGINNSFGNVTGSDFGPDLEENEVLISDNLSQRLGVTIGDAIMIRIEKASLMPKNAPFVSDTENSVTLRTTVKSVLGKEQMAYFNLKNSQSSPYNLFISVERLNRLMEFEDRANHLLINGVNADMNSLNAALNKVILPEDGSLSMNRIELTGENEITSERVFIEESVVNAYTRQQNAKKILTYFVNELRIGQKTTPYSFVSAIDDMGLSGNETIINQWIADDLKARPGDTVRMVYFEIGPLRQLVEKETALIVKSIVPMEGKWADGSLMPHLPGMSDAGHCREWEAGVPIALDKIRQKDEDYWDRYKGIPKAFISPEMAQSLWANRFGNYTAIRFPAGEFNESAFENLFRENIKAADIGFSVQSVRDDGLRAARGGVDFSQLFLGLSFFLLLAAIILSTLMFRLNLENRSAQTGTLMQLGFPDRQIFRIIFSEAFLVAISGIIAGILLAVAYTRVVFSFLNTLWWDIVRTNLLFIHVKTATLFAGAIISLLVVLGAIYLPVRKYLRQRVADLHRSELRNGSHSRTKIIKVAASILLLAAITLIISQILKNEVQNPAIFFMAGGLLLAGLLLFSGLWFSKSHPEKAKELSVPVLAVKNISRNRSRSLTIIILFALGTFIVVSTGANRQDMFAGAGKKTSGAGGYHYFAETSLPVLYDLNDPERRIAEGLPDDFEAVQFHRVEGDDASCLNLNRISNPAILGVDPQQLNGRFSFVSRSADLDPENPWLSLEKTLDGDVVPAIADQTVILWGLGMKIGDTLMYQNEIGDTLKLELIGGLAPSIFQGYVIIANRHFLNNYPTHSGSSVFLIDSSSEEPANTADKLQLILRDNGWEMTPAPQRLAEFYSVTNTYLSIFLALGALGLALGTIGLALVLARSVIERRREIAVMLAIGFEKRSVTSMLAGEYIRLLLIGTGIGLIAALVATLPALISKNTAVSFTTIAWVTALIIANGLIWIYSLASLMVKPGELINALREE